MKNTKDTNRIDTNIAAGTTGWSCVKRSLTQPGFFTGEVWRLERKSREQYPVR